MKFEVIRDYSSGGDVLLVAVRSGDRAGLCARRGVGGRLQPRSVRPDPCATRHLAASNIDALSRVSNAKRLDLEYLAYYGSARILCDDPYFGSKAFKSSKAAVNRLLAASETWPESAPKFSWR